MIAIIEGNGGRVMESPISGSLVAWLTRPAYQAVQSAIGFLAVEPYHAAFKLEPSIGRTPLPNPIKALSDVYTLEVMLWRGENQDEYGQRARRARRFCGLQCGRRSRRHDHSFVPALELPLAVLVRPGLLDRRLPEGSRLDDGRNLQHRPGRCEGSDRCRVA